MNGSSIGRHITNSDFAVYRYGPKYADRLANSEQPDHFESNLIWVYTVCLDRSVLKLRITADSGSCLGSDLEEPFGVTLF